MKTYYRDFYGCTASISTKHDGTVRLVVRTSYGKKSWDKVYKNERSARSAMGRLSDGWCKNEKGGLL